MSVETSAWAKEQFCGDRTEIGRAVGMDHSAVLRAIDESKAAWLCDPAFRSECHRIGCRIPVSLASMIGMDGETEERGRG